MYTSEVDSFEWQTQNSRAISSAPQRLPPFLQAPPGWHSEVIHSNSPVPIGNQIDSTTYQESFTPTDVFDQTYVDQGQTIFNEQQERNIIHQIQRQNPPPLVVRRRLPNDSVVYRQNVSVRYLQPPPLPPPGPLIIREVRPPQPPPLPPIRIRERQEQPRTPPPVVLRERPPPLPQQIPTQVINKVLPPPPQAPRGVIVEHFGRAPPKPANVIIERWLPYKSPGPRRVLVERAPPVVQYTQEPNLVIHYDSPKAHIRRQYIDKGVTCADPDDYIRQYGMEIDSHPINTQQIDLLHEATRAIPPPRHSLNCGSCHVPASYEYIRSITPPPPPPPPRIYRSVSYDDCSTPRNYCNQSSSNYGYETSRSYVEYPTYYRSYDIAPSWNRYYDDSYSTYPHYYSSSSFYSYPSETIRVRSDGEFRDVMHNLTRGRVPASLGAY